MGSTSAVITNKYNGSGPAINVVFGGTNGTSCFGFFSNTWYRGTGLDPYSYSGMKCYTGTWNGTTMSTYVNGVLLGSTTPGGTASSTGLGHRIGGAYNGGSYITGYVGEVRIYSQALTSAEVLADYNYVAAARPYA